MEINTLKLYRGQHLTCPDNMFIMSSICNAIQNWLYKPYSYFYVPKISYFFGIVVRALISQYKGQQFKTTNFLTKKSI